MSTNSDYTDYKLSDGSTLLAHPVGTARRCRSPIEYGTDEPATLERMPSEEWDLAEECGWVDTRRVFSSPEDEAENEASWSCSTCGGSYFVYVDLYTLTPLSSPTSEEQSRATDM